MGITEELHLMSTKQTHSFGIDCETSGKASLMRSLGRLVGTIEVIDNGRYREDAGYSVVRYEGDMTEQQFEAWAYRVKAGQCVVGTFKLL
ncbi:hypothetical protein Stalingrad_1 [Pseudomonas phage Stalingrad]|uniref:Uncharacterized protein n=1 Tax=Pseudomonas phage Stalingrad TaxID=2762287 RepID=A0A7G8LJ84_9CAUD|nr:hypothetical protein Stalingrad_1 [Pseudomonas phage Stalingrad]